VANRTGQTQGIPVLSRDIRVSGATPVVSYARASAAAQNAGQPSFALAQLMRDISGRFEDRLDIQAQADGLRQGTIEGAKDQLPQLQDETTIRGRAFNAAARDSVLIRIDMQGRKTLSDLEEKNQTDAGTFRKNADAFLKGHADALRQFDPAVAQQFEAEYSLRADAAEGRIQERHRAIVRDRQIEQSLRYQIALQDELGQDAASLFSGDAKNAQATFARMIANAAKMADTASQIGPDGQPLFSARERVSAERAAQQEVARQVGLSWMRSQPDTLQAFKDWQDGKAYIPMQGEDGIVREVNLKDMLGENGYQMAGKEFAEDLRSEISLQNQIETAQDRAFKDQSDALYADLSVAAQNGSLTLKQVDDARRTLEPDRYITLREIAKGGFATVSDGTELTRLMDLDADGVDISADLRAAKSKLTQGDFVTLYNRNTGRVNQGVKDPIQTGRDYLTKGLGALSKEIGLAQSASIGGADAEYDIEISAFVEKNKRQPTYTEARDIAENVRARYSVLNLEDSLLSLPLPRAMTQAEKLSRDLSPQVITEKVRATNDAYLKKHNGNQALRNADPEYLREIKLLKQYSDLLQLKEKRNAGISPAK
jgi:hypothetical protein